MSALVLHSSVPVLAKLLLKKKDGATVPVADTVGVTVAVLDADAPLDSERVGEKERLGLRVPLWLFMEPVTVGVGGLDRDTDGEPGAEGLFRGAVAVGVCVGTVTPPGRLREMERGTITAPGGGLPVRSWNEAAYRGNSEVVEPLFGTVSVDKLATANTTCCPVGAFTEKTTDTPAVLLMGVVTGAAGCRRRPVLMALVLENVYRFEQS